MRKSRTRWPRAHKRGAMTFALPGRDGSYSFEPPTQNPFVHQELIEILYHTLWETVHVFFEHRELGYDVGDSGFLYPFLGEEKQPWAILWSEVAASIRAKGPGGRATCAPGWPGRNPSRSSTPRAPFTSA